MKDRTRADFIAGGIAATVATVSLLPSRNAYAATAGDLDRLYAAAKTEGKVVWWLSSYSQDTAEAVRDAFVAKYPGIDVELMRQTAAVVYQRTTQNFRAGIHECDVVADADEGHFVEFKKMGALAPYRPADVDHVIPSVRHIDPDDAYQTGSIGFLIIQYNPKSVSSHPNRWTALLDPAFRDKLSIGDPAFSAYLAAWGISMHEKYGWDYFTALNANHPKIGRSSLDAINDVIGGERVIGSGQDSYAWLKRSQGYSIAVVYPEDSLEIMVAPVAVLKDAPHPNAARLFESFYFSPEYSRVMAKTFNFPIRTDVPSGTGLSLDKMHYTRMSADHMLQALPEVVAKWREIFTV